MRRHFRIAIRIWKILNEKYQVKSRKYGYGEIDVFVDVSVGLISSQGRVRSSKHRRSSIQGGHNSSLATLTVCCSKASWIATLSSGLILSSSSMQATPLSARTKAPASSTIPPVFSRKTAAVSPAAVVPLPEV